MNDIRIDDRGAVCQVRSARPRPAVCCPARTAVPEDAPSAASRAARSIVLVTSSMRISGRPTIIQRYSCDSPAPSPSVSLSDVSDRPQRDERSDGLSGSGSSGGNFVSSNLRTR